MIGKTIPSNAFAECQAEFYRPVTVIIFPSEGKVLLVATHRQQLGVTKKALEGPGTPNAESDDAAASSADDALQAEDFSKFFTDKISQIWRETD